MAIAGPVRCTRGLPETGRLFNLYFVSTNVIGDSVEMNGYLLLLLGLSAVTASETLVAQMPDAVGREPDAVTSSSENLPDWLPFPIPATAYQKWRKYGEWDYKQLGSAYREATMFSFGATAKAAGLDEESIRKLAAASRATQQDVVALDDPELPRNFRSHAEKFEALRGMAEKDAHVLRIAADYTNVDEVTQQQGDKVGLSAARWDEYRAMFKALSLSEGLVRTRDFPDSLLFIYKARGLCTGGSSSGYIYSVAPVSPVVTAPAQALDTEARKRSNTGAVYVFTKLGGHWYAFYQIN